MVLQIVDVATRAFVDQRGFDGVEPACDLARWCNEAAHGDQVRAQFLYGEQILVAGPQQHFAFQLFDAAAQVLHDNEVVVHDHVQQRVQKVIGARSAQAAGGAAQAFAHGIEHIAGPFLEGDQQVGCEHEGDLLALDGTGVMIEREHLRDHEKPGVVFLHLRPVIGVEHIFQQQCVQIETLAHGAQHPLVHKAVDIDPGDLMLRIGKRYRSGIGVLLFVHLLLIEGDDAYARCSSFAAPHMDQRSGWRACLLRSLIYLLHRGASALRSRGRSILPKPRAGRL